MQLQGLHHVTAVSARIADNLEFYTRVLGIPAHSETVPGVPIRYVLFPRPGFTLQRQKGHRPPDRYTHGGLSLAECMVPMVVMGPRRADQPVLAIENVQQVGSVSAGEELALEITVVASQLALPDLAITLAFSRDEIPTRREVFCGLRATYTVRWQPWIAAEDRQGEAVTLPVTVILTYRQEGRDVRVSRSADVRVKFDPNRLHRRVDSKLDLLMGKVPRGLKS